MYTTSTSLVGGWRNTRENKLYNTKSWPTVHFLPFARYCPMLKHLFRQDLTGFLLQVHCRYKSNADNDTVATKPKHCETNVSSSRRNGRGHSLDSSCEFWPKIQPMNRLQHNTAANISHHSGRRERTSKPSRYMDSCTSR
jgi:hypothetical protein